MGEEMGNKGYGPRHSYWLAGYEGSSKLLADSKCTANRGAPGACSCEKAWSKTSIQPNRD